MWYNMSKDCLDYITSCRTCNQNKKPNVRPKASLGQFHAGFPLERVHLDILGPFYTSEDGNNYVLMMIDQFTISGLRWQLSRINVPSLLHRSSWCTLSSHLGGP